MFIDGFGISSYRSFGSEIQFIGPCNKINIFIGQNNSGKSNILKYITEHLSNALASARPSQKVFELPELDQHMGINTGKIKLAFGLKPNGNNYSKILKNKRISGANDHHRSLINHLLQFSEMTQGSSLVWFVYEAQLRQHLELSNELISAIAKNRSTDRQSSRESLSFRDWGELLFMSRGQTAGGYNQEMVTDALPYILKMISPVQLDLPQSQ
jgi:predicted ATP-dependent endonuclease of OLD family